METGTVTLHGRGTAAMGLFSREGSSDRGEGNGASPFPAPRAAM